MSASFTEQTYEQAIICLLYTSSSQSGGEGEIRKNIINADLVECIVAMPTQLFYTTQIPVSLWFLNKQKKQSEKTLFIDARKMGTMVSRKLRELTEEDIKKIADTYDAFTGGVLEDVKGFCAVATIEQIAKQEDVYKRQDMESGPACVPLGMVG